METNCRNSNSSPEKLLVENGDSFQPDKTTDSKFFDEVDGLRAKASFNWVDITCLILSIFSYLVDLATDGFVAVTYYQTGHYWYFGLTVFFVVVPAITMSGMSTKWYIKDQNNPDFPPVSKSRWVFRIFCLVFFLSPVARYTDTLFYGIQSKQAKKKKDYHKMGQYYARMAYEDADATFLRLFECFMESAPQLVLQLYIMMAKHPFSEIMPIDVGHSFFPIIDQDTAVILQAAAVISSVISLGWALTTYNRSLRYAQVDKENIHLLGTIVLFLAHVSGICARVIALSVFAREYSWLIWLVCLGHWILMAIWLWFQKISACTTKLEEFFFCLILAIIHVFTFFNVKPDRTRFRYAFYYTVCFLENSTLVLLWWFKVQDTQPQPWFYLPALIGQFTLFMLSIGLLFLYYKLLHPNLLLPNVAICTMDTVCLSNVTRDGCPSPLPARLGRLDTVESIQEIVESKKINSADA